MKAFLDSKNRIRLFRPEMNMKRFNSSLSRLVMPTFDEDQYLECLKNLLLLDKAWIPSGRGYSLYIRPTAVSTQSTLGVSVTGFVKNFVVCSPVGPYFPEGFTAVKLLADPSYVRAWPGGTGYIKCGGNYAMGMAAMLNAQKQGCSQVLWLYGDQHQITEAGTMNVMFFWKTRSGELELITAPLDGTSLPGVTRDSSLALSRSYGEFKVSERVFTMQDVVEASEEGRIIEAFGCGTAAIVCPVKAILYNGKEYKIPLDTSNPHAKIGKLTNRLCEHLMDIQYGITPFSNWSVVIE